jgi:PKD repeat protein
MKGARVFLVLTLIAAAFGCRKRKYPPEVTFTEREEIYVDAIVGNESLKLTAGQDSYYCYTSCDQQDDGIYLLAGELRRYDCNPCPSSLRIEIADYEQRLPGASVPVASTLRTGKRGYAPLSAVTQSFFFAPRSNRQILSAGWSFYDGSSTPDSIVTYGFTGGLQSVSLTVHTPGNCENTVANRIFIAPDGSYLASVIEASASSGTNGSFNTQVIGGRAPFVYKWNFGDGTTSTLEAPTHTYQWPGSYPVKLFVTDADGKVCESNYNFVTANDLSSCAAGMRIQYTGSGNALLDKVKIQWTDASNSVFKSNNIAQPADSYFEILKSEEYNANDQGTRTRLLTMRINVLLSDGTHSVRFKSDNAVMAVAYK